MFHRLSQSQLLAIVALFLISLSNRTFFAKALEVYPLTLQNSAFLLSLWVVFGCAIVLILALFCYHRATKPVLIVILLTSALASYFMDQYHIVLDTTMMKNIAYTDPAESLDLISLTGVLYAVGLGVLPAAWVYWVPVAYSTSLKAELVAKLKLSAAALLLAVGVIVLLGDFYASFFREHKSIRYYSNPGYYLYSGIKYLNQQVDSAAQPLKPIGLDAKIPTTDPHRELIILVVGESARADRFSLNGYGRETNPLLKTKGVISLSSFRSCGTSTAVSVPCLFSIYPGAEYRETQVKTTENLLDVVQRAGVHVLWLDNNSDSKGVALRVPYQSYKAPDTNPICDVECRDEGMLARVQDYINQHPQGDILLVLHQMGNHGPAYYKRYPPQFEQFKPACQTNQLEQCSKAEIDNAYDNAILYTDYFLSKVIELLERNEGAFEAALLYVSDHGESLGENGIYLHGLPNWMAPDTQRQVPAILWFSPSFDETDRPTLLQNRNQPYSHDHIFHTILGLLEIESAIYNPQLDIRQHGL